MGARCNPRLRRSPIPSGAYGVSATNPSECPVGAGAGCRTLALDGDVDGAAVEEGQAQIEASGGGAAEVIESVVAGGKQLIRVGDGEGDGVRSAVGTRGDGGGIDGRRRAIEARVIEAGRNAQLPG